MDCASDHNSNQKDRVDYGCECWAGSARSGNGAMADRRYFAIGHSRAALDAAGHRLDLALVCLRLGDAVTLAASAQISQPKI
jgi:hypothetical protein